jgi:small subunit ribosomal protein S5
MHSSKMTEGAKSAEKEAKKAKTEDAQMEAKEAGSGAPEAKAAAPAAGGDRRGGFGARGGFGGRGGPGGRGRFGGRRGDKRGDRRGPRPSYDDEEKEVWVPKTALGKKVAEGQITDINEILRAGMPIMESGLVDKLLPGLNEEVIHVRRVQRTLDSGRRTKFSILATIGDKNGHVGVGMAKGIEAGPTIKKAIAKAKTHIVEVPRSCSSWECGCGEQHTVPFKVVGKSGSVRITLKPAPKGVGLVVGDNSKRILEFAGIKDVWESAKGHHRTVVNQAFAVFDAIKKLSKVKSEVTGVKKHHKKE